MCIRDSWYIEFEGEIIGELVDCEYVEMFRDEYTIISKNKKWDSYLFDEERWLEGAFIFKNKHYNLYVTYAFATKGHDLKNSNKIEMRQLYLTRLD